MANSRLIDFMLSSPQVSSSAGRSVQRQQVNQSPAEFLLRSRALLHGGQHQPLRLHLRRDAPSAQVLCHRHTGNNMTKRFICRLLDTKQHSPFTRISPFCQLVHGPCSKTRVAYILSLLREQPTHPNDTTLLEEDEEESDEEGDITMFDPEVHTVLFDSS